MVTWDVSITVYISWVLGFAGILLLPYDLSVAEVLSHISFIILITNFLILFYYLRLKIYRVSIYINFGMQSIGVHLY